MRLQTATILVATSLLGASLTLGGWSIAEAQINSSGSKADVRRSIEIFRRLHGTLSARSWRVDGLRLSNFRLPDQAFAEDSSARDSRTIQIFIPGPELASMKEIAFTSDIYVRKNYRRLPDGQTETSPEGFYLVAWKDGRIEQVPVTSARMFVLNKTPDSTDYTIVFPGQAVYREDLPLLPFVQIARSRSALTP